MFVSQCKPGREQSDPFCQPIVIVHRINTDSGTLAGAQLGILRSRGGSFKTTVRNLASPKNLTKVSL